MSANNWLHCNKCFTKFQSGAKFYLTDCQHIFCHSCAAKVEQGKQCIVCNKICKLHMLSNSLSPTTLAYFQPLVENLEQVKKITIFQSKNQTNFINHLLNKYNYAKSQALKLYKMNNDLKQENLKLKNMMGIRGGSSFLSSTPMSHAAVTSNIGSPMSTIRMSPKRAPGNAVRMGQIHFPRKPMSHEPTIPVPVHNMSGFSSQRGGSTSSLAHVAIRNSANFPRY